MFPVGFEAAPEVGAGGAGAAAVGVGAATGVVAGLGVADAEGVAAAVVVEATCIGLHLSICSS